MLINANTLHIPLASKSVHVVATSPPYWGLRDYKTAKWEGGDASCDHSCCGDNDNGSSTLGDSRRNVHDALKPKSVCKKCGAVRVDGQLGSEKIHDCLAWARQEPPCGKCYVCNTRLWAREVRRVLRDDGLFWLNLGDSYNGSGGAGGDYNKGGIREGQPRYSGRRVPGLKAKDLAGIPYRVGLALQSDGWYWRSTIPWVKVNAMPEPVRDRPVVAHEYVLLLSKGKYPFYDVERTRVPYTGAINRWAGSKLEAKGVSEWCADTGEKAYRERDMRPSEDGRLRRTSDWFYDSIKLALENKDVMISCNDPIALSVKTRAFKGAHFACWPLNLVRPMLLASTSEIGCCPYCGTPWIRVVQKGDSMWDERKANGAPMRKGVSEEGILETHTLSGSRYAKWKAEHPDRFAGFVPGCPCYGLPSQGEIVCPSCGGSGDETVYKTELVRKSEGEKTGRTDGKVGGPGGKNEKIATGEDCKKCTGTGFIGGEIWPDGYMDWTRVPAIVLDPFAGSGATGVVAKELGLNFIGLDLNSEYLHKIARERIGVDAKISDLPMFSGLDSA